VGLGPGLIGINAAHLMCILGYQLGIHFMDVGLIVGACESVIIGR
jgi:hypothetical protein